MLWLSIMETLNLCIQNFGVCIITLLYVKIHKITKETLYQDTKLQRTWPHMPLVRV
jgi:hypothetical protein